MIAKTLRLSGLAALASVLMTGCIGYNSTFFATKTNVGLDIDSKTPTMEVSVARREAVVEPSFENGQTPPVAASFRTRSGAWITADIDATFSGGDAAYIMTRLYGAGTPTEDDYTPGKYDSKITLSNRPTWKILGTKGSYPSNSTVRPLIFGTDTSLGVKVAWSGLSAQYPDSVKIGFNRKEMAFAPVSGRDMGTNYVVKMPSFLATMDSNVKIGAVQSSDNTIKLQQYFATGDAANHLALQPAVREAMAERLDPVAQSKKKETKDRNTGEALAKKCQDTIDKLASDKIPSAVDKFQALNLLSASAAEKQKNKASGDPQGVKDFLKDLCGDLVAGGAEGAKKLGALNTSLASL